uniref:CCHC-type domain-containing protein n=2 Tax=Homalodisca liturata TaxID=320908 RepID=A0A1B6HG85_9HEMI
MASSGFKLADLKVADLKRELEERDLDTSGTKTVLANRLKQAMIEAGEDPEILIFETEASKLTKVLQSNLTKTLEEKLNSNCETLQNDLKSMKDELATEFNLKICRIEEEFKKQLEAGINGCSKQLEDKLNDYSKEFGDRIRILEEIAQRNKGSETCTESIVSPEDGKPELITEPQLNSCPPMSNAGVPTFDGKMTWEDFRTLFETAAAVHRWPSSTKASMLCLSLRGDALKVLQTVPPAERQNYGELVRRLEMRFGHKHMELVYRSQLRSRHQKSNESLQEFEADIARLVRGAYSTCDEAVCENLSIDKFLDGLRDAETQQAVKLARPKTLHEALTQALEFEAVKQSVQGHARLRGVCVEEGFKIEDVVQRVLDALKNRKKEIRCWSCGELGHPRSKCPDRASRGQMQEN